MTKIPHQPATSRSRTGFLFTGGGAGLKVALYWDRQIRINNVKMGENVRYFDFVNLYGCQIGNDTKIGTFVEIKKGAVIGARCNISSHTFVCDGVRIGDNCFIGHGVMFINDKHPRATIEGKPITDEWTMEKTIVEDNVSIGSNATILCGITLGRGCLIGAGTVVTKDVLPGATVVVNPARKLE